MTIQRRPKTPDFKVQADRFGVWVEEEPTALVRFQTVKEGTRLQGQHVKPVIHSNQLTPSAEQKILAIAPGELRDVAPQVKAILGRNTSYKDGFDPEPSH